MASSLIAVRDLGLERSYFEHLPAEHHDAVRALGLGAWLTVDLVAAHYAAYDAMELTGPQLDLIAETAQRRTNGAMLRALGAIARQVGGLSPAHLEKHVPRIWERSFRGGEIAVEPTGAKEARVRIGGLRDLGASPFFRGALTRHFQFGLRMFARSSEVRVLPVVGPDLYAARLIWE